MSARARTRRIREAMTFSAKKLGVLIKFALLGLHCMLQWIKYSTITNKQQFEVACILKKA